jgi:mRNA interferase MazF
MQSSRQSNAAPMPERGEIWLANLNPRRGTEPGKSRPVLVIQAQALLDVGHPSTLIIPLTTNLIDEVAPLRIRVQARERLRQASDLLIDQLRAIDNTRLLEGPLARLDSESMRRVGQALLEVLDLSDSGRT